MYQQITVIGNLGADPEMRYTASGRPVTNFSVAANRQWTDRESGETTKETTWFRVVAWGRLAETCNMYLTKGRLVAVVGRMQSRKWEDDNGESRTSWELVAQTVKFLGSNSNGDSSNVAESEEEIPF
jgi:single-strand DNA-binding protein